MQDRLDILFALAASRVSEGEAALLAHARANAPAGLPAEMQALALSDGERAELSNALRAEAQAARRGEDLHAAAADLLADVRSDGAVLDSAADLAANLEAVEAVFGGY